MTGPARALPILLALFLACSLSAQEASLYLAFGDSITLGLLDDPGRGGYPQRLQDALNEAGTSATVQNEGLEGETTVEGLPRLRGLLTESEPNVLLLMEGTNDISSGISEETTLFNLEEMEGAAEGAGAGTVFATLPPRGPNSADPNNLITGSMAGGIRVLAWAQARDLADPYIVFFSQPGGFETLYADALHPNAAGYDLLATIFADVILERDTVPPVEGRTSPANATLDVPTDTPIEVEVFDFGTGINVPATEILLNGEVIEGQTQGDTSRWQFVAEAALPINRRVEISLRSEDLAVPPNTVDRIIFAFVTANDGGVSLEGDIDGDGRVDGDDLVLLALAFGSGKEDKRYLRAADLDDDGFVDGEDLAILASNFGRSS